MRVLKCHVGVGSQIEGEALVADDNFSARCDLDRIAGTFSRPQHKLAGQSYNGRILVLNTAKGGVASSYGRKLVTAGIGKAAYRGVALRPHFSTKGAICRAQR